MNKGETREQLRAKRQRLAGLPENETPREAAKRIVREAMAVHREALHLEEDKTLRIDPAAYILVGCQEASILSRDRYRACNRPAKWIVANKDSCIYFMCDHCADHNVKNRGGVYIAKVEPGFIGRT